MVAEDTRERILEAAERLFGERGFDGTSIRDVTTEAGANIAAVHYHFGSKEDLLREVLARALGPSNAERLRCITEAEARPGGCQVEDLLWAFIYPQLAELQRMGDRATAMARLVGRIFSEPNGAVHSLAMDLFHDVGTRFIEALGSALPGVPRAEVIFRMQCVVAVFCFFMADTVPPPWKVLDLQDPEEATRRIVSFLLPAVTAPPMLSSRVSTAPQV